MVINAVDWLENLNKNLIFLELLLDPNSQTMVCKGNLGSVTYIPNINTKNGRWWGWEGCLALEARKVRLSGIKLVLSQLSASD